MHWKRKALLQPCQVGPRDVWLLFNGEVEDAQNSIRQKDSREFRGCSESPSGASQMYLEHRIVFLGVLSSWL